MEHMLYSVIIPYFNFFAFVVAIYFLARKPLAAMAAARRTKFLEASNEAKKAYETANAAHQAISKKIASIDAELADFLKQSADQSKADSEKIEIEGERLAAQITSEAKKLTQEEVDRAKRELRAELVAAASIEAKSRIEKTVGAAEKDKILAEKMKQVSLLEVRN